MQLSDFLDEHRACTEARAWHSSLPPDRRDDVAHAWDACPRADWLLWFAGRLPALPRPLLVLAACACARAALVHVPAGEARPLRAIETAEAWARGGEGAPTMDDVRRAADAAAAAADAAADAAYAATYAAYAAAYAADAAAAAAAAAYAAADAADAADADWEATRIRALEEMAPLVLAAIPTGEIVRAFVRATAGVTA